MLRKNTRPIIPGAEPWSSPGSGDNARIGILLSHGFTGNPSSMRWLGERLAARGFAMELPRLPGHGTHWRDMAKTTYDDWRAGFVEALHELKARTDHVIVAGLSMGGTIALDVAWEFERELAGVVAINATVLEREGLLAKLAPVLQYLVPIAPAKAAGLVENDAAREGVDEKAYAFVPAAAGNSFLSQLGRIRRQLPQLHLPVLVAYAPQDHSVPPANSRAILDLVGTWGEELVLPNSYHLATMDLDRELLEERIAEFARRVSLERSRPRRDTASDQPTG
ncbi:MAG: alpha/beta fold hydrolase [Polyangiaceae bacterium]|nr:alpha/beta fold hydrolase [Polyangiaceae bacterium]MCB9605790.1 alpha/beta fold hydrolase [Polyangiaceae bacterium]